MRALERAVSPNDAGEPTRLDCEEKQCAQTRCVGALCALRARTTSRGAFIQMTRITFVDADSLVPHPASPRRSALLRFVAPAVGLLVVLAAAGCGGKRASGAIVEGDPPDLVPECEAYAKQLRLCLGEQSPPATHAATQSASLAKADDAERSRMATTCSRELERLRRSCR